MSGTATKPTCTYCGSEAAGFTLIETVVTLALLSLLLGGAYALFAGTISAWRKAEERAEIEQNLRQVARLVAGDLENLFAGTSAILTGSGPEEGSSTGGSLHLTAVARRPEYGSVVDIRYEVTPTGLVRKVYTASELQSAGDGEEEPVALEDELVSPYIKKLSPQFLVGGEWQTEPATDTEELPTATQVMVWAGMNENEGAWRSRMVEVNVRAGYSLPVREANP